MYLPIVVAESLFNGQFSPFVGKFCLLGDYGYLITIWFSNIERLLNRNRKSQVKIFCRKIINTNSLDSRILTPDYNPK